MRSVGEHSLAVAMSIGASVVSAAASFKGILGSKSDLLARTPRALAPPWGRVDPYGADELCRLVSRGIGDDMRVLGDDQAQA